jgi:hypothetical protein
VYDFHHLDSRFSGSNRSTLGIEKYYIASFGQKAYEDAGKFEVLLGDFGLEI